MPTRVSAGPKWIYGSDKLLSLFECLFDMNFESRTGVERHTTCWRELKAVEECIGVEAKDQLLLYRRSYSEASIV